MVNPSAVLRGGFKRSTIERVKARLIEAVKRYARVPVSSLRLCLSDGNTKIGKVLNVSLPPLLGGCAGLCSECGCDCWCYAVRDCFLRGDVVINARARNWSILLRDRDSYFNQIDAKMSRRRKNKFFRWHVSGEIPDFDYFCRMVENARRHPDFIIWAYTKRYSIVNAYCNKYGRGAIPENFSIMFSEWRGYPMPNPYGFPCFHVMFEDASESEKALADSINWGCAGDCGFCLAAGRGCPYAESVKCKRH